MAKLGGIRASEKVEKFHGQCPQWTPCKECGRMGCVACIVYGLCPECNKKRSVGLS